MHVPALVSLDVLAQRLGPHDFPWFWASVYSGHSSHVPSFKTCYYGVHASGLHTRALLEALVYFGQSSHLPFLRITYLSSHGDDPHSSYHAGPPETGQYSHVPSWVSVCSALHLSGPQYVLPPWALSNNLQR